MNKRINESEIQITKVFGAQSDFLVSQEFNGSSVCALSESAKLKLILRISNSHYFPPETQKHQTVMQVPSSFGANF